MRESLTESSDDQLTHRLTRRPSSIQRPESEEVARWVQFFAQRWHDGERPVVEDLLKQHVELADKPDVVVHLVCEEICLRQEYGEPLDETKFYERFPQWEDQIRVLLDCRKLFEYAGDFELSMFPEVGQVLGEFSVVGELGRGAQSRVFLATQQPLADRHVVLKVVNPASVEHRSLARLQHTNIVPLYSIHAEPTGNWLLLCMPYFGSKTFSDILRRLRKIPIAERTGNDVVEALDSDIEHLPELPRRGPARTFLSRLSYSSAICWIGACLADAIEYAHERELLHLDIKPSNVLVTVEAIPMLLDFHLAQPPLEPMDAAEPSLGSVNASGSTEPSHLGGTYAYMSPEQRQAIEEIRAGKSLSVSVGPRSDVYSLGVLLCEAFGAKVSEHTPCEVPRDNPMVTPGLGDILAKALASNPSDRYSSANEFGEDLRRHVDDRPLKGVANRSWRELWEKWNRRNPFVLLRGFFAALIVVFVVVTLLLFYGAFEGKSPSNRPKEPANSVSPKPPGWAEFVRGKALRDQGMLQAAKKEFEMATVLNPARADYQFNYGVCCYRLRDAPSAIRAFSFAIKFSKGKERARCYANRGMAYASVGEKLLALRDYDSALNLDRTLGSVYLNVGALHYQEKNYQLALDAFHHAEKVDADVEQVLFNLALAHQGLEATEKAIACLEELLQVNPTHPQAMQLLRRLRQTKGRKDSSNHPK